MHARATSELPSAREPASPCAREPALLWRLARRALRLALTLGVVAGLVFAASYVLRSEWFLRGKIDPRLEQLGERLGGDFSYTHVAPIGLTGVAVEGLVFTPDARFGAPSPVSVERIEVYPSLSSLLVGDLEVRRVVLSGLEVEVLLDGADSGRGHWPWIEAVVEGWRAPVAASGGGGDGAAGPAPPRAFPEVVIERGRVDLRAPRGSMPELGLQVDGLSLRDDDGRLALDGAVQVDGLGYALLAGGADRRQGAAGVVVQLMDEGDLLARDARARHLQRYIGPDSALSVEGIELQWPPALIIHQVRLSDTHIALPGREEAHVESVALERVRLSFADERVDVRLDGLDAGLRLKLWGELSTAVPLRLPLVEIGLDFARRRFGVGFDFDHPERGALTLNAALDLEALDFGLRLQARDLDAGGLLSFIPYTGPITVRQGRLDGSVALRFPLREELAQVDVDVALRDVDVDVPWISDQPLRGLDLGLDLGLVVDLRAHTLQVPPGSTMRVGALPFAIEGTIRKLGHGRHVALDAHLSAQDLPAERVLDSLPAGFAPALDGYALAGALSLDLALTLDTRTPEDLTLTHHFDVSDLEVLTHGPRADIPLLASDAFAIRVHAADGPVVIGPSLDDWTPMSRMPRFIIHALVAAEDNRFFSHHGFDVRAIHRSVIANLEAGRIVRGGSTITQQLAKNLFLSRRQTVARKLQEAFLAWQLEQHLDKHRILELYLNMVHWGEGVHGIRQAAQHYFRRLPHQLALREVVFLAAILPNPERFGRQYAEGFIQADRLTKMRTILTILLRRGALDLDDYNDHLAHLDRAHVSSRPRPRE